MKEWKIRQQIYHKLSAHLDRGDNLNETEVIEESSPEKILQRALEYPFLQRPDLYYPGKSFAIAVIYARLIEKHFQEEAVTLLKDPLLLYGNDPYFTPYDQCPEIYDSLLNQLPADIQFDDPRWSEDMKKTLDYFKKEFLLEGELT